LTGKALGITGEVGEYLAAKHLGLKLADVRTPGYDATDGQGRRIQVKARVIPNGKRESAQPIGSISLDHDWDVVVYVRLDETFEAQAMYEAQRDAIKVELNRPGSKARNERGQLSVAAFKRAGHQVWSSGHIDSSQE